MQNFNLNTHSLRFHLIDRILLDAPNNLNKEIYAQAIDKTIGSRMNKYQSIDFSDKYNYKLSKKSMKSEFNFRHRCAFDK